MFAEFYIISNHSSYILICVLENISNHISIVGESNARPPPPTQHKTYHHTQKLEKKKRSEKNQMPKAYKAQIK